MRGWGYFWLATVFVVVLSSFAYAGADKWTSSGPFGIATNDILIYPQNPSIAFVTGDVLYRTTNGGGSWTAIEIEAQVVAAHPRTGELFAAGYSVYHSTNQGASWQIVIGNPFRGTYATDIKLDPSNPLVLYVATANRGIFKSVNGGKSWSSINAGLNLKAPSDCSGGGHLAIDPSNTNNLYTLLPCTVYKSTNSGGSWKASSSGLNFGSFEGGLDIDPGNPGILYAGGGVDIFKTTNGGDSWAPTNCNCGVEDLAVDPKNPQIIYGAALGVIKSVDGGHIWRSLILPPPAAYLPRVAALGSFVLADAYDGGLFRSNNGGAAWKEANQGINNQRILFLAAQASRPSTVFGSDGTVLFKTANGGGKWTRVRSAVEVFANDIEIHPQNANLIVVADATSVAAISTNGGNTWNRRAVLNDYGSQFVALDPQNQNNMFVASLSAGVARSTDRGMSWALANAGLSDLAITALECRDGQNVFAGTRSGKIFRTSNGGSSWENSSTGLGSGEIFGIVINKSDPNIVYLSTNYQGKGVYKSTDGGRSWTLKSKGFVGYLGILGHPSKPDTLYAPAFGGIQVTSDGAESWSFLPSNGLGVLQGFSFLVHPGDQNTLYAGTNRGVFSYGRTVAPGGPVFENTNPPFGKTGSTITIAGSGFGATQGSSRITFGTVNAGTARTWSDTSVTVNVPSGSTSGAASLIVGGKDSNPIDFVIPANTGKITPVSGPAGTRITLTLNAKPTSGFIVILFGLTPATQVQVTLPNFVTCIAPPGTGIVPVTAYIGPARNTLGAYTYH